MENKPITPESNDAKDEIGANVRICSVSCIKTVFKTKALFVFVKINDCKVIYALREIVSQ